jgi:hypothetical protein
MTERPTLHQVLETILRDRGNPWLTTGELAVLVNQRDVYRKEDGSPVDAFQVHGRTRNHPQIFERDGSRVRLRTNPADWDLLARRRDTESSLDPSGGSRGSETQCQPAPTPPRQEM